MRRCSLSRPVIGGNGPRTRGPRAAADGEAGSALLIVFLFAAVVAIHLYIVLPNRAFEQQREREQQLIERGEDYERAIRLYFRRFHQYPASLQALENTNSERFLRRQYVDPMTGKRDWRLIHIGPGGLQLVDSRRSLAADEEASSPASTDQGSQAGTISGGIAGVASANEHRGIKVYRGGRRYSEWEFSYEYYWDRTGAGYGSNTGSLEAAPNQ
jgi:type II secretory pathway pseudopilin PulG